jgi:hypothetical protein
MNRNTSSRIWSKPCVYDGLSLQNATKTTPPFNTPSLAERTVPFQTFVAVQLPLGGSITIFRHVG